MTIYDPKKKFQLKQDVNATPLDKEIVKILRENAYKHTKYRGRK
jgi:hypothetical protein